MNELLPEKEFNATKLLLRLKKVYAIILYRSEIMQKLKNTPRRDYKYLR